MPNLQNMGGLGGWPHFKLIFFSRRDRLSRGIYSTWLMVNLDRGSKMTKKIDNLKNVEQRYQEYASAAINFTSWIVVSDGYSPIQVTDLMREEINKLRVLRDAWHNAPFFIEKDGE
jgi:hypothetical protein